MTGPQHVRQDWVMAFRAAHAEVVLDRRREVRDIAAERDAIIAVTSLARVPGVALLCSLWMSETLAVSACFGVLCLGSVCRKRIVQTDRSGRARPHAFRP